MECTVLIDDRLLEAGRQAAGTSEVQTLVEVGLRELVRSQQLKVLADSLQTASGPSTST
jgi:Arc/MetJ family transcription regulator